MRKFLFPTRQRIFTIGTEEFLAQKYSWIFQRNSKSTQRCFRDRQRSWICLQPNENDEDPIIFWIQTDEFSFSERKFPNKFSFIVVVGIPQIIWHTFKISFFVFVECCCMRKSQTFGKFYFLESTKQKKFEKTLGKFSNKSFSEFLCQVFMKNREKLLNFKAYWKIWRIPNSKWKFELLTCKQKIDFFY